MPNIRVLDLFCGEGGAFDGYARAGAGVVGVDISKTAIGAVKGFAIPMDWREGLEYFKSKVEFIHASPPCQGYTNGHYGDWNGNKETPRLISEVRTALKETGLPFVIENVPGSEKEKFGDNALRPNLTLTGKMFSLTAILNPSKDRSYKPRGKSKCRTDWGCGSWKDDVEFTLTRKRLFECHGFSPAQLEEKKTRLPSLTIINGSDTAGFHRLGHRDPTAAECCQVMGIDRELSKHGVAEAIPPVYTEYIFSQWFSEKKTKK